MPRSFVLHDRIDNRAYSTASHGISMLYKDGSVRDVAAASDHLNLSALSMPVERHFLAYPKEIPPRPHTDYKGRPPLALANRRGGARAAPWMSWPSTWIFIP